MKVLMINGSPRQKGNTYIALSEIAKQLAVHGIDSDIAWIGNKPLRGCIGCGRCKDAPGACAFDDDVCNGISAKMNGADALILGSPVYYGQPTGALLAIFQRMLHSNGAAFKGKPAAAVAVCRRGGGTAAFQTLSMPFFLMNMPVGPSQYWNIVYGLDQGEAALDTEGMQTMRTLANNLAAMLKATGGAPVPGCDEPHASMNFIR